MVLPSRRALCDASLTVALATLLLSGAAADRAGAQSTLNAHYRATLGGMPIGSGAWTIDLADDHYTMAASGQASGFLKAFATGDGAAAVRGGILGSRLVPASYAINVRSKTRIDQVKMALSGGAVKELSVEPPVNPDPNRTPLTEAHKRGVLDPFSAGMLPRAGADGVGPEACQRTVAVFDGRMRFDLALSFKRIERVKSERGYEGPAVVCAVSYNPVGGHEKERFAVKFLRESRDLELWFAPIAGTRFLAVYRISIPTMLGAAVLQATRFVATAKATRAGAVAPRTQ